MRPCWLLVRMYLIMVGKILLLLAVAGASNIYLETRCDDCLCTIYKDGCVKADCGSKNVSTLPPNVPNQTCYLIMRDNRMQTVRKCEFQRLINLTTLDLSANLIYEIKDGGFVGLSKLMNLNLSDNHLDFRSVSSHTNVFKPLVNLKQLELNGNAYEKYPGEQLSVLSTLENLTLDGLQNCSFGKGFSLLTKLTSINLSGNTYKKCNIRSLYLSTFDNIETIKSLNISYCNISYVEPGTFSPLQNIDTLDLSYNENLLFPGVWNVSKGLQTSKLRHLIINKIVPDYAVCVVIDKTLLEYLGNTSLEIIEANYNRIEQFGVGALENLKNVKHISARKSRFTTGSYLKELDLLSSLISLDLSGNHVSLDLLHDLYPSYENDYHYTATKLDICRSRVMNTFNKKNENLLPISYQKRPVFNSLFAAGKQTPAQIPRNLKTLKYSFAELNNHLSNIYLADNSLDYIDLSFNVLTHWPGPVFGVENVTHLDLSNNIAQSVNLSFFENFKSLQFLNISRNILSRSIFQDYHGTLFRNLSNLQTLDLYDNHLIKLPFRLLEGLSSLKTLNISENSIYTLEINYTSNTQLQFIDISDNQINFIPEHVRESLDYVAVISNLSIDLSWNPFTCTCDPENLHFLDWLHTTKVRLEHIEKYQCVVYNNKKRHFEQMEKIYQQLKATCKFNIILTTVLLYLLVVITTAMFCGIVYRYRWRLVYLYYVGKRKIKVNKANYETLFDFDAFVSYADQDIDFVRTLMLSRLEFNQGLNLYIRDRDSLPGATIAENIIDGIQRSKKSILLISKASLSKQWNTYELQMANMEAISTKRDVIIIVMLESVPNENIPSEILYHIQKNPPLQYPADDQDQVDMFWASLIEEIRL